MQRPTGITILAILYFLGGVVSLVMSFLEMAVGNRLTTEAEHSDDVPSELAADFAFRGNFVFSLGLFGTSAALFRLVAATGLWTLQPWGWRLALLRGALKLVSHLTAVVQGAITPASVVGALVNGVVLFYLFRPHVRQALSGVPNRRPDDAAVTAQPRYSVWGSASAAV